MVSALFPLSAGWNVGTDVPCGIYNQAETQNEEPGSLMLKQPNHTRLLTPGQSLEKEMYFFFLMQLLFGVSVIAAEPS